MIMPKLTMLNVRILFGLLVALCPLTPAGAQGNGIESDMLESIQLIPEALSRIHENYVEEVDNEELIQAAVDGMLRSLDPHSGYISPEEMIENEELTTGEFGGVGMTVTAENGFIKIISPTDDTPAYRAGLMAEDYIIEINGETVLNKSLSEGVDLLRGPPGSEVTLTIRREGLEPFEVTLIREIIEIEAANVRVEGDVLVARVKTFNQKSVPNLTESFEEIFADHGGMDDFVGVVIDLRNNPGGTLDAAIGVTDLFLEDGIIVSVRNRDSRQNVFEAERGDIVAGKPMVVLINRGTASASEIFAGAVQDHNRGVVVGTQSFGKGSVQTIHDLDRQLKNAGERKYGGLRITTAKYYTPSGRSIQGNGITPDIVLPFRMPDEEAETDEEFFFSEAMYDNSLENDGLQDDKDERDKQAEIEARVENVRSQDNQLGYAIDLIHGLHALN